MRKSLLVDSKKNQINEIVSNTFRGVKAVIEGDTLEYSFRSATGKGTATAIDDLIIFPFLTIYPKRNAIPAVANSGPNHF